MQSIMADNLYSHVILSMDANIEENFTYRNRTGKFRGYTMKYCSYQHKPCLNILETLNKFIIIDGKLIPFPIAMANSMAPAKLQH